ncbi:MAG: PorP/SprF family type IX secretion system membrane protein [Bacteroidota bacterium]
MKRVLFFTLLTFITCGNLKSQSLPIYRQYYLTPSILNPAFNGIRGFNTLNLFYRQQFVGIDGAPEVFGLNFQLPTKNRLFFGLDIYSEEAVLLRTSSAVITLGYEVPLGENQSLRFAISGGVGNNSLDLDAEELNTIDQTILLAMDDNFYVDGRFGFLYTYKNLHLGVTLPQLFNRRSFSNAEFNDVEFSELRDRIFYGSYTYAVNPFFSIKPTIVFNQTEATNDLTGALGIHYQDRFWIGATYENTLGGFAGVSVNNFLIQYNYESSSFPGSIFDNASHGVQLSIKLGKNKKQNVIKGSGVANESISESTLAEDTPEKNVEPTTEEEKPTPRATNTIPSNEKESTAQPLSEETQTNSVEKSITVPESLPEDKNKTKDLEEDVKNKPIDIDNPDFDNGFNKRKQQFGLDKGYYVVVGVFSRIENGIALNRKIRESGFDSDMVINPKNDFYYVFVYYDPINSNKARDIRKQFRKKKGFGETWIMEIK